MTSEPKKSKNLKNAIVLIISLCLLVAILIGAKVFLLNPNGQTNNSTSTTMNGQTSGSTEPSQTVTSSVTTQGTTTVVTKEGILDGVSIGGINVSGMTRTEAMTATASLPGNLLDKAAISMSADGVVFKYTAKDIGIMTDYEVVIAQALAYGQTGTAEERKQAADQAKSIGMNFTVHTVAMKEIVKTALLSLKNRVDKTPVDATAVFMPNGYTEDGKAYEPDARKLADAHSVGKNLTRPKLVLVDPASAPNPLRYLYWNTNHYMKGYIPADANISHFLYTPEVNGRTLDMDALSSLIMTQVESGAYSPVMIPFQVVEPAVKLTALKNETQLISSWSSSYHGHYGTNRNWNVSRMSSFINGAMIKPGGKWTINTAAGFRTDQTAKTIGWKKAAGIENGGYTQQVGGGVCQLGSTTFNAVIRAGVTIVSATHHTIPSDYIPLGLDATLSTPAPDLILRNDKSKPVYLVSYVNPKDQNVTVEVYGELPVDPQYGQVIYDFTSDNRGSRYGSPTTRTIYNATVARDDTILSASRPIYVYSKPRTGTSIQTYKRIYSLDGKALIDPVPYEFHKYPVINGTTYVFGPDPATITPTPIPTIAPPPPTVPPTPIPTVAPPPPTVAPTPIPTIAPPPPTVAPTPIPTVTPPPPTPTPPVG